MISSQIGGSLSVILARIQRRSPMNVTYVGRHLQNLAAWMSISAPIPARNHMHVLIVERHFHKKVISIDTFSPIPRRSPINVQLVISSFLSDINWKDIYTNIMKKNHINAWTAKNSLLPLSLSTGIVARIIPEKDHLSVMFVERHSGKMVISDNISASIARRNHFSVMCVENNLPYNVRSPDISALTPNRVYMGVSKTLTSSQIQELLNFHLWIKCTSFDVWVRYFAWNFKGYLWNSAQNILPIHWKIRFLYNIEMLRALWFKSS